jgi:hypothetical protein
MKLDEFAAALDAEADKLRERGIAARAEKAVVGSEADEWAISFATAYQTLRGIAAALRANTAIEALSSSISRGEK